MTQQVFSIVVPVYYNEANLPDTVPQLLRLEESLPGYRLELIFVDDGSGDRSLAVLRDFQARHPAAIRIVKLARNFGSMAAIQAGLLTATGDCVGMIAADLQDPPELFIEMIRHWERGAKSVFAVRADREEGVAQRLFAGVYYSLLRRFALPGYPAGGFDFFLIDRQVLADVNRIREKNTNIMSLMFWLGYNPILLPYVRRARKKGRSRWTLAKKMKLFIDSFVAFSYMPIRMVSAAGLIMALGAFAYATWVVYMWAIQGIPVKGYAPTVILIAMIGGIQMLMLGILGEYLWRALDETRRRPVFVVDEVFESRVAPGHAEDRPSTSQTTAVS